MWRFAQVWLIVASFVSLLYPRLTDYLCRLLAAAAGPSHTIDGLVVLGLIFQKRIERAGSGVGSRQLILNS